MPLGLLVGFLRLSLRIVNVLHALLCLVPEVLDRVVEVVALRLQPCDLVVKGLDLLQELLGGRLVSVGLVLRFLGVGLLLVNLFELTLSLGLVSVDLLQSPGRFRLVDLRLLESAPSL